MNSINYLIVFLLILTVTDALGQSQEATIIFQTEFLRDQKAEFRINGLTITPDDKRHKIKIYRTNFDTLTCWRNEKKIGVSLLKFKENAEYVIKISPCSFYDIRPTNNFKTGVVRYNFIYSKIYAVKAELDFYSQKIISGQKSNYYSFIPSAMCIYGKKKIALTDLKSDKEFCNLYFNFLHGEKLTFTYDSQNQEPKLTLNGYITDDETYPEMDIIN